ncbi:MAG: HNH endonuclease [Alphaproteobacteria bacterium]|nr:HNH endonuclease [Alphaproteobacteria bacterium]
MGKGIKFDTKKPRIAEMIIDFKDSIENWIKYRNKKTKNNKYIEIHIDSKKYGKHIVLIDYIDAYLLVGQELNIKKDITYKTPVYYAYINNTRLHRIITGCPDNMVVDHINHNTLDNRRCNLRVVTNRVNAQNKIYTKKIPEKYIYWHSRDKVFEVIYVYKNQRFNVGRSPNLQEAIKIRNNFLKEHNYE